jgi:hypothetical protein
MDACTRAATRALASRRTDGIALATELSDASAPLEPLLGSIESADAAPTAAQLAAASDASHVAERALAHWRTWRDLHARAAGQR